MQRVLLLVVFAAAACGDDDVAPGDDAGTDAAREPDAGLCAGDDACDDGVHCNGDERCAPGAEGADARGCVAGEVPDCADTDPCTTDACDEGTRACSHGGPDEDGDGHELATCGGDDCDGSDADRFPGNPEVCDEAGHDEDCDPTTFGERDADGDGWLDGTCCNDVPDGACGDDCDDAVAAIHPTAYDRCDPAMVDDDCSGTPNDPPDGCVCSGGTRACPLPGECAAGVQSCLDGLWGDCSIAPRSEICDTRDDDCDGTIDEGLTADCWPDIDDDGYAPVGAAAAPRCTDPARAGDVHLGCEFGYTGRDPALDADADCDDHEFDLRAGVRCHVDADRDGFGTDDAAAFLCNACPAGTSLSADDCCDVDPETHPGADFQTFGVDCGGYDFDCDGTVEMQWPSGTDRMCRDRAFADCLSGGAPFAMFSGPVACGAMGLFRDRCVTGGPDSCTDGYDTRRQGCR